MWKVIIFLFILVAVHLEVSLQDEAGVKVRISQSGLQFGANLAVDLLASKLNTLTFPNIDSYGVSNIKITRFVKPDAIVVPVPGSGISASLNDAVIELRLDWKRSIDIAWFSYEVGGSGSVKTKSISISTTVVLGRDGNGKPTAASSSCSCSISGFSVDLSGGGILNFIYNFIIGFFENSIKNSIQESVCDKVVKLVDENAASELASLNTEVKIDSDILLDYSLTESPVFTSEYMETSHAGQFFTKSGIKYNQITPPTNIILDGSKMANLALTERLFNSAGFVIQRLGRINKIFPIKDDGTLALLLNLAGDTQLQLMMEATEAPFIAITKPSFAINATVNIQVQKLDGSSVLSAKASILLTCDIYFEGNSVKGKVLDIVPQIILSQSIGTLSTTEMNAIFGGLARLALPSLNERAALGFPIPCVDGLVFANPVLQRAAGYVQLGTDLSSISPQSSTNQYPQNPQYPTYPPYPQNPQYPKKKKVPTATLR